MKREYIVNPDSVIDYKGTEIMSAEDVVEAMNYANEALFMLDSMSKQFDINLFQTLGMRNLSSTVGEYFVKSVEKFANQKLVSNPHQDGYPDLLLNDTLRKQQHFNSLFVQNNNRRYPINKESFSNYEFGGIEIKATCGSTPPANLDKNIVKPLIGEQRVKMITQFDWKSHHRQTNHLIGVVWDFIDGVPTFVGAFFQNELDESDWGQIVKPTEGGGRTTSVSIMNSKGVKKMCRNWIAIINDSNYIDLFSRQKWIGYRVDNERLF